MENPYHKFRIMALYRSDHGRALTAAELKSARAALVSLGNHSLVLGDVPVYVFGADVVARAGHSTDATREALRTFRESAEGAEVFSCHYIGEEL